MWWVLIGVVVLGGALAGPVMSNVERPKYETIQKMDGIEIRDYAPLIIAEVTVTGEREKAIEEGFRILADYIFGKNISSDKISMTAPVTQTTNQKLAMTAPVLQQGDENSWTVGFVMPSAYTLETIPKPIDKRIELMEIPKRRLAVIEFSGLATDRSISKKEAELSAFIAERKMVALSTPVYAFYNPPWTLPFLRRNEVMQEITISQ